MNRLVQFKSNYYPFKFSSRITKKTEIKPDLFDPHLHHFQEAFGPSRIVHLLQPCVENLLMPVFFFFFSEVE